MNLSDELYNIAIKTLNSADLSESERSVLGDELVEAASMKSPLATLRKIIAKTAVHCREEANTEVGDPISDFTPMALTEAESQRLVEKGIAKVTIIKPGFNTSKARYYKPDTLKRDFGVFEGAKMFLDHPQESMFGPEGPRSVKDWAASLKNVSPLPDGTLVGEAVIVDNDFKSKVKTLREHGLLGEMGVSINAFAKAQEEEIDGIPTVGVDAIVACESVDFVSRPGAGGQIHTYEHAPKSAFKNLTLEALEQERPDLVKAIRGGKGEIPMDEVQKLKDEIEAKNAKISTLEAEAKAKDEGDELATLTAAKESAEKERDEIRDQLTAKEAEAFKAQVEAKLVESDLPEASQKRLAEQEFDSVESLESAVESEKEYISELTGVEEGQVRDLGPSGSKNKPIDLTARFERILPKERAKVAASL